MLVFTMILDWCNAEFHDLILGLLHILILIKVDSTQTCRTNHDIGHFSVRVSRAAKNNERQESCHYYHLQLFG